MNGLPEFTVAIPWRATPSRTPFMEHLCRWYKRNFGVDPILCDTEHEEFNRAGARNECVRQSRTDIVVINDADTIPEFPSVVAAIQGVATDYRAHLPFTKYRWLTPTSSVKVLRGQSPSLHRGLEIDSVGGVQVTTKKIWDSHRGQDERFVSWGYEDTVWALAHETLIGDIVRIPGMVYSLNHERTPLVEETQNLAIALRDRYLDAVGDVEAMRQIVFTERGF